MPSFRQLLRGVDAGLARAARRRGRQRARRSSRRSAGGPRGVRRRHRPAPRCVARRRARLLQRADPEHGGFGGAPKFPTPTNLDLLLAACDVLPAAQGARGARASSCSPAARWRARGLYDQLGGGFHRYSVDAIWASRTSRRCSTTRASCCASTPTRGGAAARATRAWPGPCARPPPSCCARCARRRRLLREPGRRQRGRRGALLRVDARPRSQGARRASARAPSAAPTRVTSGATSRRQQRAACDSRAARARLRGRACGAARGARRSASRPATDDEARARPGRGSRSGLALRGQPARRAGAGSPRPPRPCGLRARTHARRRAAAAAGFAGVVRT